VISAQVINVGASNAMSYGGKPIARKIEKIGDLIVNRQESLDLSRRFELLHDPLSSPRRLM
jgi:hypothetical protein